MAHNRLKKAFSLIEISLVILIIGILVAGISKGFDLYKATKLTIARNLTKNSRVARIDNLVAWYETTSENSFSRGTTSYMDIKDIDEDRNINRWKDNKFNIINRYDATQVNSGNQPKVVIDSTTLLPVVNFNNSSSQFFNLPDGTVPHGNSPYTIIVVPRFNALGTYGVLGSGTYNTNNATNAFRASVNGNFINYWWSSDAYSSNNSLTIKKFQIFTVTYDQQNRKIFINGSLNVSTGSSNRASTRISNTIGVTNSSEYMNGDIAEIIIFDRSLLDSERIDIEKYLSQKWAIKLN